MNFVKDKIYIYTKLLLLLIVIYSNIFIEDIYLIKVHCQTENFLKLPKTAKNEENNFSDKDENIEIENPWKSLISDITVSDENNKKPIKGAIFGKWMKNKCVALQNEDVTEILFGLSICGGSRLNNMFKYYSIHKWCTYSNIMPDCLIYDKTAYSFFPYSTFNISDYVLPPCINASENWIIKAKCDDTLKQNYTCKSGMWIGSNNNKISNCKSTDTYESIYEDDNEYEEELEHLDSLYADNDDTKNKNDDNDDNDDDEMKHKNNQNDEQQHQNDQKQHQNDKQQHQRDYESHQTSSRIEDTPHNKNNSNHNSEFSSCGRIGISFIMLISVIAIFV